MSDAVVAATGTAKPATVHYLVTADKPKPPPEPAPPPRLLPALPSWRVLVLVVGSLVGSFVFVTNVWVTRDASGYAYDNLSEVPNRKVAIVFGAFVGPSRQPSAALLDRLRGAADLFKAAKVTDVLLTGDSSNPDFDQVSAMVDTAVSLGVPAAAISRDYAGFDTYDSCARARKVFGVTDAILVTQDFHMARALFLCRAQGINAVGFTIADWQHLPEKAGTSYPPDLQRSYTIREWLARTRAFVEADITHPDPTMGGPYEGLRHP